MIPDASPAWRAFNRSARKDLLVLALVSKTLSGFALDALWTYLDSLRPLIKLLPTDSYETTTGANVVSRASLVEALYRSGFSQRFIRQLGRLDFVSYDKYAIRVRVLGLYSSAVDNYVLPTRLNSPPLARLRKLTWPITSRTLHLIPPLCPLVQELTLYYDESIVRRTNTYDNIIHLLPWLTDLRVFHTSPARRLPLPVACNMLSGTINQLPQLRSFRFPSTVNHELVHELSRLPHLECLQLGALPYLPGCLPNSHNFPSLKALHLGEDTPAIAQFMTYVSSPLLHHIGPLSADPSPLISPPFGPSLHATFLRYLALAMEVPSSKWMIWILWRWRAPGLIYGILLCVIKTTLQARCVQLQPFGPSTLWQKSVPPSIRSSCRSTQPSLPTFNLSTFCSHCRRT
jgi:hypothetical protein